MTDWQEIAEEFGYTFKENKSTLSVIEDLCEEVMKIREAGEKLNAEMLQLKTEYEHLLESNERLHAQLNYCPHPGCGCICGHQGICVCGWKVEERE